MLTQGPQTSLELLETTVIKIVSEHAGKTLSALVRENEAVTILVEQGACQEAAVSSTAGIWLWARIFQGTEELKCPAFTALQSKTPDSIRALKNANVMYRV